MTEIGVLNRSDFQRIINLDSFKVLKRFGMIKVENEENIIISQPADIYEPDLVQRVHTHGTYRKTYDFYHSSALSFVFPKSKKHSGFRNRAAVVSVTHKKEKAVYTISLVNATLTGVLAGVAFGSSVIGLPFTWPVWAIAVAQFLLDVFKNVKEISTSSLIFYSYLLKESKEAKLPQTNIGFKRLFNKLSCELKDVETKYQLNATFDACFEELKRAKIIYVRKGCFKIHKRMLLSRRKIKFN